MYILPVEELYKKYPKLQNNDVKNILEWLKKQPHLPQITELEVAIFLKATNYRVENAKTRIDGFYTIRTLLHSCFSSRDIMGEDVQAMKKIVTHLILPKRTPEGCKVILHKFLDSDPSKFDFQKFSKMAPFTGELELFQHGPEEGIIIIVDLDGAKLGHVARLNLTLIKKLIYYLTETFPGEFIQFHYINTVSFMDKVMLLTKQFLRSELMQKVYVHKDVKGLSKFLPLSILPSDYEGGEEEPAAILWDKYFQNLCDHREYFLNEEKTRRVNEKLRATPLKNIDAVFGLEGNFKKLDID